MSTENPLADISQADLRHRLEDEAARIDPPGLSKKVVLRSPPPLPTPREILLAKLPQKEFKLAIADEATRVNPAGLPDNGSA